MKEYFKRILMQLIKGLSQLGFIVFLPSELGGIKYAAIDYILTWSRSISSFFEGPFSIFIQDEFIKKKRGSLFLILLISLLSFFIISIFRIGDKFGLSPFVVPFFFLSFFLVDIFTRVLDLRSKFFISSLLRVLISFIPFIILLITKDIFISSLSLLIVPIIGLLNLNSKYYNSIFKLKKQFKKFLMNYWPLVIYGFFSVIYSMLDRTLLINYVDESVIIRFSKFSRLFAIIGFLLVSLSTFLYRDVNSVIKIINDFYNRSFFINVFFICSALITCFVYVLFNYIYILEIKTFELLFFYIYSFFQVLGQIYILISLRKRSLKKHLFEGIAFMIFGLIIGMILFINNLFIEGIFIKMLFVSVFWTFKIYSSIHDNLLNFILHITLYIISFTALFYFFDEIISFTIYILVLLLFQYLVYNKIN